MTGAVLVTGAGARLGAAMARRFAGEGHDIALHYNTSDDGARAVAADVEAAGRRAVPLQADLSSPDACADLVARARDALPGLNGLVNSASVFERDTLATMTPDFLRRQMRVNAEAPLYLTQALWRSAENATPSPPGMTGGNDAEDAGHEDGWVLNMIDSKVRQLTPEFFSYTLSKLALEDATRMLAMACAPRLRVNAIAPGLILRSGAQTDAQFEALHDRNPLQRGPTVEDICDMAVMLAGARGTTGQVVTVDGGRHFYSPGHPQNT